MIRVFQRVPDFASSYPDRADTIAHARLSFYCINCYRKAETAYLTPNFGPFCRECMEEVEPLLRERKAESR